MRKYFRYLLLGTFLTGSLVWGALKAPDFIAPGGAECDLKQGIIKYYAAGTELIEANWNQVNFKARYLEYNQKTEILNAKMQVKIVEKTEMVKTLSCQELVYEHKKELITAKEMVKLTSNELVLTGEFLNWERNKNLATISGSPKLIYLDWEIVGSKFEAELLRELCTVYGPVSGKNSELTFQADKVIFDRKQEKVNLEDNVLIVRQGREELMANKIVYDLKTKKFKAIGPVKSRIIEMRN